GEQRRCAALNLAGRGLGGQGLPVAERHGARLTTADSRGNAAGARGFALRRAWAGRISAASHDS
ncbi:MAG: hypothetical protein ACKOE8_12365, partial [Opitutaceae bacterium]